MSKRSRADKQHGWLSQVEISGVVLSEPVLIDAAPAGFRALEKKELAKFHKVRETWLLPPGMVKDPDTNWVGFILEEVLELKPKYWRMGATIPEGFVVDLTDRRETLRPTRILMDNDEPIM